MGFFGTLCITNIAESNTFKCTTVSFLTRRFLLILQWIFRLRICRSRLTPHTKNVSHGLNCQMYKHIFGWPQKSVDVHVLFCQLKDFQYICSHYSLTFFDFHTLWLALSFHFQLDFPIEASGFSPIRQGDESLSQIREQWHDNDRDSHRTKIETAQRHLLRSSHPS
jgi:hypothetical protein